MSVSPPPLPSSRPQLFLQLAKVSWMSVIIACGANVIVGMATGQSPSPGSRLVSASLMGLFALIGIISGIIALTGVRRYGRRGLLWPAITGLVLWLLLFGLAVPAFLHARKIAALRKPTPLSPPVRSAEATRVSDTEIGFSFELPKGYEAFSPAGKPPGYRYAFIRQVANEPNRVLLVKPLGGTLPRQRLRKEEIPAGQSVSLLTFNWRGLQVDGIRVPEKIEDIDYLTFNIQIPLRGEAIQLGFGGPAEAESQLRALAEHVLSTLEGETNW